MSDIDDQAVDPNLVLQLEALSSQLQTVKQENAVLRANVALNTPPVHQEVNVNNPPLEPPNSSVCRVSLKIPPFWYQKPAMWFAHIESHFRRAGITGDLTKYDHVIEKLDFKITDEIEDIITNPPEKEKYNFLKTEIIRRLSQSEEQRVRKLLSESELGDQKPSQFLRHLRSLAGNTLTDEGILRQLFMRRLPQNLQALLAARADTLDNIALDADKILEVVPTIAIGAHNFVHAAGATSPTVFSTSTDNTFKAKNETLHSSTLSPSNDPFGLLSLSVQIKKLTEHVAAISSQKKYNRSRSHSRHDSTHSRSRTQSPIPKLCWYHKIFKEKANKCITPCTWNQENSRASQ